ncbi:sodium-dependent serotonin transporter-like [Babylonia areolata]|uniref:sodium-dependent serotonin transporter-like n=1 Tax=Babylonia areolata TaxID=304850 RepID=UPI003FD3143B
MADRHYHSSSAQNLSYGPNTTAEEAKPLVYPALPPEHTEVAMNGSVLKPETSTTTTVLSNTNEKHAGANGSAVTPFLASGMRAGDVEKSSREREEREGQEEEEGRQTWDKKLDFVLAIVGFAIDLGNVWRFPYICYKNGGGAFLIPYLLMLAFLGLPLFYMELALGQFHRRGPITIWRHVCPVFCGIGYGICIVATFVGSYYNTIIGWALYYLVTSFRSELLFATCDNSWNTAHCVKPTDSNGTNDSVSAATEFFNRHVLELHKSSGIDDLGAFRWQLLLCVIAVFIIIFFCLWKGTKSSGKAVWVTATLPFLVLFVLFVRGVTLPGSRDGVLYYLRPDFSRLAKLEVWVDAAAQIFFSLGPGFGALIALSSYNKFHNNCFRDALMTSCINCGTSFMAGVVVFSVLGYMAHMQNTSVDKVATQGPGLVFVVYAEAISTLSGSVVWAILFFLMLITLGLDSSFAGLEAVITAVADEFSFFRSRRSLLVGLVCGYSFILGLPTVTQGGNYFIYLMDTHAAPISLLFICFTEVIAVNWFYGVRRFAGDIESMLGFRPNYFWCVCWTILCPLGLCPLFVLSLVGYMPLELDGYVYPGWALAVGWMVTAVSILCIPAYAVFSLLLSSGTWTQRWRQVIRPQPHVTSSCTSANITSQSLGQEKNGQVPGTATAANYGVLVSSVQ